ncbi:PP2C family protein-serine/threonine phosphatase [Actinacidiphila reveromycinica]|uniref:PP2C family protein-serine/threonine phosphatase n=1 Tax=Actinacidiphila reveromycinica TaxID=659352 RepID=UPI001F0145E3|nr:SpoIIE family protein phosphatase [Streptomyces sp. SN-593]
MVAVAGGGGGGDGLDYAALFAAMPAACIVLDRELTILALNDAYTEATGRTAADLVGLRFFDAYPPDPGDPASRGAEVQRRSLETALASGRTNILLLHRFTIPRADRPEHFAPRWWNVVNRPVRGPGGQVELLIHQVDDVTEYVRAERGADDAAGSGAGQEPGPRTDDVVVEAPRAELFTRARELQRANARLQESAVRTHDVALTLQRAMLATPDLAAHPEVAVRYLPALEGMNACGDWYDVVDLPEGRMALSVGDVVGHGVNAASVMGMLRAALSAAIRVADSPSGALETLGLYARSQDGAVATTTFTCQLFPASRLLMYSSAGHPPPVLMHRDGSSELLDRATDPPLGVRMEHVPRPQATADYRPGDILVLYTDGLIERRGEDIDVGLGRLVDAVRALRALPPEEVADGLLRAMAGPAGQQDDISLLVTRL